jgi:hypothetical protein
MMRHSTAGRPSCLKELLVGVDTVLVTALCLADMRCALAGAGSGDPRRVIVESMTFHSAAKEMALDLTGRHRQRYASHLNQYSTL